MQEDKKTIEDFGHRNLARIGQTLRIPPKAEAERVARWLEVTDMPKSASARGRGRFPRRRRTFAFVSFAAVAAAVVLVVWLSTGGTANVSAAMIFQTFKEALGRKLTVTIEGIDLDNVTVDGEIILDRKADDPNDETDTLYTELQVLLKADNPDWNDIDGAIVVCQSPDQSWRYCRGNGGTGPGWSGEKRVRPTDYIVHDSRWETFADAPLGDFDSMPIRLSFGEGGDGVVYRFYMEQRQYLQNLLRYLLRLTDSAEAPALIDELQVVAGSITIERQDDTTLVLHAMNFHAFDWFNPPVPEIPDKADVLENVVWEVTYDPKQKRLEGWSTSGMEEPWSLDHEELNNVMLELPTESLEDLVAHFEASARDVSANKSRTLLLSPRWKIRATGYPLPLKISTGHTWAVETVPNLMRDLELTLYYNTETETVRLAEFTNVAGGGSRITLELGKAELDPARLDPSLWVTEHTWDYSDRIRGDE